MAVARASSAEDIRTGTTDPHTFVFTPAGTPKGIAIAITHGVSATSLVVSVSYGGVALRRIVRATDTVTEPGMTEFWFLGSAIPTGAQTVSIDLTSGSTTDVHTVVWELSAATDTEVIDFRAINEDVANPTVVMEAASRSKISLGSLYAGGAAPGGTLATGNTADHNHDHGNFYSDSCYETTVDNANHTIGWSTLTSDDIAFAAIAVSEVSTDPGYVDMMGAAVGSGQNVSTPDHASLDVTGSMQIIVGVAFTGTTKATSDNLITKGDPGAAAGAFTLRRPAGGRELLFAWRESGGTVRNLVTTGGTYTAVAGAFRWYKVEFVASTATGTFFYSDDLATTAVGSISWTNFGSDTDSVSSNINAGTVAMWLGGRADNPDERLDGRLFYAEVRDGIGGTIVANPDFRTDTQQDSLTQLTDDQGRVWTVTEPALWLNPRVGSSPATVTPAVVARSFTVPTPTVLAAALVAPTVIARAFTVPTPSVLAAAKVTPAVVAVVFTVPTPVVAIPGVVTPAVVVTVVTVPTPTVLAASTVTPAVVAGTFAVPTPTILAGAVVTPAVVAATFTVPTPTVLAAAVVTPAVIPLVFTVPTPTVAIPGLATPAVVAAVVTVPTPAVLAASMVAPAVVATTVTVPTPVVAIPGTATPATVGLFVTIPTPTVKTVGYLNVTGEADSRASTPDHASLDITTDFDIRVLVKPDSWPQGSDGPAFIAKWVVATDDRSYIFGAGSTGTPRFIVSTDGTGGSSPNYIGDTDLALSTTTPTWIRATFDGDDGAGNSVAKFYTSTDPPETDPASVSWVQSGSDVVAAFTASAFVSIADLWLGDRVGAGPTADVFDGRIFYAEVRNGIGGTIVANPDWRYDCQQDTATQLTDDQGRMWTVNSPATWVDPLVCPAATVTPATVALVVTVPTPTVLAAAVVTPAVVATVVTIPIPSVTVAPTVQPATVAAVVTVPTPTVQAASTVTPATVALVTTVPTPGIAAGAVVTPAVVPLAFTVPTPTIDVVGGPETVTPAVIAAAFTVPTPEVLAAAVVTPSAVAATFTVPTPTVLAESAVTPDVVAVTSTVPTPTVLAAAIVTPAVVAATTTIPTPTVAAAALVIPDTVAAVITVPTPTVLAASTVTPAVVALVTTVPTPTVQAASIVTPATVAMTTTVPTPTVATGATVTPATVTATTTVPTPTVSAGAVVTPNVVATLVTVPTPTVLAGVTAQPAVVALTVTVPTPTITAGATVTPGAVNMVVTVPTPTVTGDVAVVMSGPSTGTTLRHSSRSGILGATSRRIQGRTTRRITTHR